MRVLLVALLAGCAAAPQPHTSIRSKQARAIECESHEECTVVPRTCCGRCGVATRGDARAIAVRTLDRREAACAARSCPECAGRDPTDLVAYCASGTCRLLDLTHGPLVRCSMDDDCVERSLGCCPDDAGAPVAIARAQIPAFERRVCGSSPPRCPADAPGTGGSSQAACEEGRCVSLYGHQGLPEPIEPPPP